MAASTPVSKATQASVAAKSVATQVNTMQDRTTMSTMMPVKNRNLLQLMPQIKEEIAESVVVAFDVEMSGIGTSRLNASFDTLEQRYADLRQVVLDHSVIQLGITFFRTDKRTLNKYLGATYSFHLFDSLNKSIDQTGGNINFNYKSFQFLISNQFNIKEWANDGLYFVRQSNRDAFEEDFERHIESCGSDLKREVIADIFYIIAWLRQYKFEKSLHGGANSCVEYEFHHRLKLKFKPTNNELFNYYFVMKIRQFLLDRTSIDPFLDKDEYLWCDNHQNEYFFVNVVKLIGQNESPKQGRHIKYIEDVAILHEEIECDKGNLIAKIFSISTIFEWISQSKAHVVGHNSLLDLLFIYHNFLDQLPETLAEFRESIHSIFPNIFDTKFISQKERSLKLRYTSLLDCYMLLCFKRNSFRNCLPDVYIRTFNDANSKKDDYINALDLKRFHKIEAHNAGFDSCITGFVFLYFGYMLMMQARPLNQRKSDRQMLCDYRIFLANTLKYHCNKLHLAKNCNQPLFLASTTQTKPLYYTKTVLKFQNNEVLSIFQNFLSTNPHIDWQEVSDYEFKIGATHPDKMELFLSRLVSEVEHQKQVLTKQFSIKKYREDRVKYSTFRKISWFAFLSSATCFTFLFTRFMLNSE